VSCISAARASGAQTPRIRRKRKRAALRQTDLHGKDWRSISRGTERRGGDLHRVGEPQARGRGTGCSEHDRACETFRATSLCLIGKNRVEHAMGAPVEAGDVEDIVRAVGR